MKRFLFYTLILFNLILSLLFVNHTLARQDNGCGGVTCPGMGCDGGTVTCAVIDCPGGARVTCFTQISN